MKPRGVSAPISLALLIISGCGDSGLGMPKNLEAAHVEVTRVQAELTRFGADARLGTVWGLAQGPADSSVLVVGDVLCRISSTDAAADCRAMPYAVESATAVVNDSGNVASLVVTAPFGKPSAARLNTNGDTLWHFDGDVRNMGSLAVADVPGGRAVIVSGSDSSVVLDFSKGTQRARGAAGRAMLGANWVGDAAHEYVFAQSDSTFALIGQTGNTLASRTLPNGSWPEPVMTPVINNDRPFLVSSSGNTISVFDSLLAPVRSFAAPELVSPLHVVAAAFLTSSAKGPFVAVYNAANNWHRSVLCVFGSDGQIAYAEVLEDDHHVLLPRTDKTGLTFLLGGRGVVWQYRFPLGL